MLIYVLGSDMDRVLARLRAGCAEAQVQGELPYVIPSYDKQYFAHNYRTGFVVQRKRIITT